MPEADGRPTGAVLAFDFGEKRIGVAIGEWQLRQAHPLTTIHGEANALRFAAISALINEWQPRTLVVGRPLSLDGDAHAMTARCQRFANQLRGRFRLPVDYADERLSSIEAQERLRAAGHKSRSAGKHLDAVAAQLILQGYFDGVGSDRRCPPSTDFPDPDDDQTDACH
ncbi:Holliday junction resolvase RuvX [Accumulibacter sp.]|uniref:Holliday junction resolvase RuvX n=1 Tax=Accumulibacter sp. TaxID=2053492 RepID=UPI0025EF2C92|nr:Holliday junction resolvase RuvX [Accumulibacter sp.]MCP5229624.1 Holliday junction resolvase RuvX [Accumulibacter sp.]